MNPTIPPNEYLFEYTRSTATGQQVGTGLHLPDVTGIAWAEGAIRPGIVIYKMRHDEKKPDARWLEAFWNDQNDAKCKDGLGKGQAFPSDPKHQRSDTPEQQVSGTYTVTYYYPDETKAGTLTLEIIHVEGTRYHLSWKTDPSNPPMFQGIGVWVEAKNVLAAAWWKGSREKLSIDVSIHPAVVPPAT